jgi:transcriptional regulator with GAF, ATPase, and Fis domain
LNVVPVALPPLREREGDVRQLVHHFSLLYFKRTGLVPPVWSESALQAFESYEWPGNVRELANIVDRVAILAGGAEVNGDYMRAILVPPGARFSVERPTIADEAASVTGDGSLSASLDAFERTLITKALEDAKNNVAEAARSLKTDRANLYRRMKRLGLEQ